MILEWSLVLMVDGNEDLWIKTEFKRLILSERHWKNKLVSRVSFVLPVVLQPRSHKRVTAVEFMGQRYACLPSTNILSSLRAATSSAAEPAVWDAAAMYKAVDVQIAVTSQVSSFPGAHSTKVRPSGRSPSERDWPFGSLVSVIVVVKGHWGLDGEQSNPQLSYIPSRGCRSTCDPQRQVCEMQTFSQRRRATRFAPPRCPNGVHKRELARQAASRQYGEMKQLRKLLFGVSHYCYYYCYCCYYLLFHPPSVV